MDLKRFEEAFRHHKPVPMNYKGSAAVLVPLIKIEGEYHLLYEVRSETLKHQPGEICFPGGGMETGETAEEAALRETWEELGIPEEDIRILGPMDYIHTYSNFSMYPILAEVEPSALGKIRPNPSEVKEWFLVPVSFFIGNPPYVYECDLIPDIREDFPYERYGLKGEYHWRKGRNRIPVYQYQEYRIWGLTARITENLADLLHSFAEKSEG
ncbi:MAG: CoA pyrophosphatase [Clostridiales bacterium]|nr:CoA pyrophosphatase [Clostridiales bacterium]